MFECALLIINSSLPEPMALDQTACGALKDRRTDDTIVVIGCGGKLDDEDPNYSNRVWLWNTADNTVKDSGWLCPPIASPPVDQIPAAAQFVEIDDSWLAFGMESGDTGLWVFNLVNGFSLVSDNMN